MKAALIEIDGGSIIAIGELPFPHVLADGGTALLEEVGQEVPAHNVTYRVMQYVEAEFDRPGTHYTQGADVETRDGDVITVTREWLAWTQQEIDAYEAQVRDELIEQRLDDDEDIMRAVVLVCMDEFNAHASFASAVLQATAAATTLANFKSAMALISAPPARNAGQIKTAIRNKLGVNGVAQQNLKA